MSGTQVEGIGNLAGVILSHDVQPNTQKHMLNIYNNLEPGLAGRFACSFYAFDRQLLQQLQVFDYTPKPQAVEKKEQILTSPYAKRQLLPSPI